MLSIISCFLVHCVGEVSNLALFLMGSSSSLSLWDLTIHYSFNAHARFSPVSCWIPSYLILNLPGVSWSFGLILGMKPLGDFFLSIAVVSNCMWCLALSIDLTSLVITLMYPCWVLFSSVSVFNLDVLSWNSSGWLSILLSKDVMEWCNGAFLDYEYLSTGSRCNITSVSSKWQVSHLFLQFRLISSLSEALFQLLEGPMGLGLDVCRYQGGFMV